MDIKLVFLILSISTHRTLSNLTKCSDAPPHACGPHAKCYDDQSDKNYIKLNGPYCKCYPHAYGRPPNCKSRCLYDRRCEPNEYCDSSDSGMCIEGCRRDGCKIGEYCDFGTRTCTNGCEWNLNCNSDEFCNQKSKKCVKVCAENACGPNGKCMVEDHTRYCSCVDGFIPDKKVKGCRPQNYADEKLSCRKSCAGRKKCSKIDGSTYCHCAYQSVKPFHRCPEVGPDEIAENIHIKPTDDSEIFSLQAVLVLSG